jgi:hypothetical protein
MTTRAQLEGVFAAIDRFLAAGDIEGARILTGAFGPRSQADEMTQDGSGPLSAAERAKRYRASRKASRTVTENVTASRDASRSKSDALRDGSRARSESENSALSGVVSAELGAVVAVVEASEKADSVTENVTENVTRHGERHVTPVTLTPTPTARVTSEDVSKAWNLSMQHRHPGCQGHAHVYHRDHYDRIAVAINTYDAAQRRAALTALIEWVWVAPNGVSSRMKHPTPKHVAANIDHDLDSAYEWFKAKKRAPLMAAV